MSTKIRPQHLNRIAFVYIRQSTMGQVRFHRESTERQYALKEKAQELGWEPEQILLIDEDLGLSGAQKSLRQGFQKLVAQVSLGQVGAIFGLEISRLARSSADLLRLLELCALFDTIVVDEDGIYDLNDFNDRLILGFKGTMSEAELHFLRSRLLGGKKNKAHKGELRFPLPVGYCYDEDGNTVLDPDQEVQAAVTRLFSVFKACGSAYGVVKYFAQNHLLFPKRAYGGTWNGKLIWGSLIHSRVVGVLKNPGYAGAYVYGRYRSRKSLDENGQFKEHLVLLPQEQWEVLLHDHHPGYISWAQYEENLKQLSNNRTNAELSGPAREGEALLQGLLLCGRCGQKMTVRYTGNGGISPQYECHRRWKNGQRATCSHLRCEVLDQVIEAKIMDMLKPANLELALLALDKVLSQEDEVETGWKLALERAQYEADRAQRQYDLAEPENRLVVRSLENRWNEKLATLNSIREDYEKHRLSRLWRPSSKQREDILALAEDIPRIWNAPGTSFKDRKRIIRILIEDITVTCEPRCKDVTMGIRWRSNYHEVIHTTKPLPPSISRKHGPELVELVKKLATIMTDEKIAEHLNESGQQTPEGKLFTKDSIRWIRCRYRILGPQGGDGYTVKEAAAYFGVSRHVIYYWLNRGLIQGSKFAPGWPWKITFDDETEKNLCDWVKQSCRIAKAKKEVQN
jgi:DNA invertase Pin-like site-specific DNA recombinase